MARQGQGRGLFCVAKKRRSRLKTEAATRIDIHTFAKTANVSAATVSRVMNNISTVDPKLSKRVWEAVGRLGYVPNPQARALVSGRNRLFGVIISDITNPFFPELIRKFEEKAVEIGYETLIGSTNYDLKQMEVCIQRMIERKVDGVAVMTFGIEEPLLERLAAQGIPMAFIDVAPPGDAITTIRVDYEKGIHEAVQHLAVLGHRKIAFISGPRHLHSASARELAFEAAVSSIGLNLPSEYVYEGNHTAEQGMKGMESLLGLKEPPTAVVCSNDMTAIGVMHTAFRAGLQIPRDLSVVGFDDISIARYTLPPLTTIRMSRSELATAALLSLKAHAEDRGKTQASTAAIQTQLIVRQTTGIPRGSLADLEPRRLPSSRSRQRRGKEVGHR
jgi:DNA-binding LacI/PurR family transcriptional regulator